MAGYTTVEELTRVLRLRQPTEAQVAAMKRVIAAAAFEIDSECLGTASFGSLGFGTPYPALAAEVNVERAVEHWQQQESPFGVIGLAESVPTFMGTDTWNRHALKLTPLKGSWGLA